MTEKENNQEQPGSDTSEQQGPPRSDGDEALEQRKRELEEELESYAQAGAYSPTLVKASRWVSRFLYFTMAAVVVFLLLNQKKYDDEDMQRAVDRAQEFKDKLDDERAAHKQAEARRLEAELNAAELRHRLDDFLEGAPAATRAQRQARGLVELYWGERAYAEHWRGILNRAEPEAHGVDPVQGAASMIRQAAAAPAGRRFELLREAADFGAHGVFEAAAGMIRDGDAANDEEFRLAALLMGRLDAPEAREVLTGCLETEGNPARRRALLFALETAAPGAATEAGNFHEAEAWVGLSASRYEGTQEDLITAYRDAPEENRLELMALLAETSSRLEVEFFSGVATSQRPPAERIIAVRWLGERGGAATEELLKTLGEGQGVLAEEAKKALDR